MEERIKSSAWNLTLTVTDLSDRPIPKAEIVMEDGIRDAKFRLTDRNGFATSLLFRESDKLPFRLTGIRSFCIGFFLWMMHTLMLCLSVIIDLPVVVV